MTSRISATLSEEKLAAIRALFACNGWDWNSEWEMEIEDETPETTSDSVIIPPDPEQNECPECFCRPCVVDDTNRQLWWPENPKPASSKNNKNRKMLYKKFWTMLCHRGVWQDRHYVERKSRAISLDLSGSQMARGGK